MLRTAPSFNIYNLADDGFEGEEKEGGAREELVKRGSVELSFGKKEGREREELVKMGSVEFSFGKMGTAPIEEKEEDEEEREVMGGFEELGIEENGEPPASPRMHLATGLGIDGADGYGGSVVGIEFKPPVSVDESGGGGVEEYCKRMVDEYPGHPLFLKKYAQLLQSKGDLQGAENYYYRATLADPGDGEVISQYAILVWELHRDHDRALSYFERALQVAPDDCHILAAYTSFMWEIEDNVEEDNTKQSHIQIELKEGLNELRKSELGIDMAGFSCGTAASREDGNFEEYYRKMVEENPSNPLFLGNYAQFLYQFKGDLQGAEQYYSRAILADPGDGEIMSQYAKLVWELHHDRDKALSYFDRAVQATPGNCNVLAAHASFLWETEEDEEKPIAGQEHVQFKGDLQGSEQYYSRAILADPRDGEMMLKYANFLWEQHHDLDKASFYFERAIQASPGDGNILAAHASFLWETQEDEEESFERQEHVQEPILQGVVTT